MSKDPSDPKNADPKAKERTRLNAELERRVNQRTAQLEMANNELIVLARIDALTGIPNHRAFEERLTAQWQMLRRVAQVFHEDGATGLIGGGDEAFFANFDNVWPSLSARVRGGRRESSRLARRGRLQT